MLGTQVWVLMPVNALSLDELVPADHFYRHLDRVRVLGFVRNLVRDLVRACYALGRTRVGGPSVDPVVCFTLQLIMFFEGDALRATSAAFGG